MAQDKTDKTDGTPAATLATRGQHLHDETPEAYFLRLQADEANSFERARSQAKSAGPAKRENLSREWFAASSRLIKEYLRISSQQSEGVVIPAPPSEALLRMANIAEALSAGRIPDPVKDVTAAGGRPNKWPMERRDIAVALDYIEHAKAGRIKDKAYAKRVENAFQVDRTTVRDWQRKASDIRDGLSPWPAESCPDALKKAGARYHFNRTGEKTEGVD